MTRTTQLPLRVNDEEAARIAAMAEMEKLPISTFIRRRLLFEADQRGIYVGSRNSERSGRDSQGPTAALATPNKTA